MIELVDAERAVYLQQRGWAWKFKRKGLGIVTPSIKISRNRSE